MNILRSMNAYQMYRQEVKRKVEGKEVVRFLLHDKLFPRSVAFCLNQIIQFAGEMPNPERITTAAREIEKELERFRGLELTAACVSKEMDDLQKMFGCLHNTIEDTWFNSNINI